MDEPKSFTYTGVDRECFCCGKVLHEDYPSKPHNPLETNWLGATDWTSYGNWCSTMLDCGISPTHPKNCKKAHIVICDGCFKNNKDRIVEIQYTDEEMAKLKAEEKKNWENFQKFVRDGGLDAAEQELDEQQG
jgi:hypothetical protein